MLDRVPIEILAKSINLHDEKGQFFLKRHLPEMATPSSEPGDDGKGYHDLYIDASSCVDEKSWKSLSSLLLDHGYSSVAVNVVFKDKVPSHYTNFPDFYLKGAYNSNEAKARRTLRVYRRATLILESGGHNLGLSSNYDSSPFDILAIQPTSEKAFQLACSTLDIDIISLKMTEKLPFYLRKPLVNLAIKRGIYFELLYGDLVLAKDSSTRRDLLANWQALISVTKGKNVIVSSGGFPTAVTPRSTKGSMTVMPSYEIWLRQPEELMNIITILGCPANLAPSTLSKHCVSLLYHAATRRLTFKSILSIEPKCLARLSETSSRPLSAKRQKLEPGSEAVEEGKRPVDHLADEFISFE